MAITINGQNQTVEAKPTPVIAIIPAAANKRALKLIALPRRPNSSVMPADPSKVPVTMAPMATGLNPRSLRYCASRTLTKPSAKPRRVRPAMIRVASGDVSSGRNFRGASAAREVRGEECD